MRKKRQQSQKQKQRSWFQNNFISRLRYLARNSQRECLHEKFEIMQSIQRKDLC